MIVEITTPGRSVRKEDGFLAVGDRRLPMDDVEALILTTSGVTVSAEAMLALAKQGSPVIVCESFKARAVLVGLGSHYRMAGRIALQAGVAPDIKAQLWRHIVRFKLLNQAALLQRLDKTGANGIAAMAERVQPGDPDNLEAQAARRYWQTLLGSSFRRDTDADGTNACLNWGYAVLRAGLSRAVAAAGLHPALGIHHCSEENPLSLCDDLIEPYRPYVDQAVTALPDIGSEGLTRETKEILSGLCDTPVWLAGKCHTIRSAMRETVRSLVSAFEAAGRSPLLFPDLSKNPHLLKGTDHAESVSLDVDAGIL